MLDRADSAELSDWLAYEQVYGLPDAYFIAGTLAPLLAVPPKGERLTAADFVPYFDAVRRQARARDRPQTGREMRDAMLGISA